MAIDPFFGTLIASALGFGGALLGGSDGPQKRNTFSSYRGTDPRAILASATAGTNELGKALAGRTSQGVKLRSTYNAPKGMSQDPAKIDPSLLEYQGMDLSKVFGNLLNQDTAVPRNQDLPPRLRTRR